MRLSRALPCFSLVSALAFLTTPGQAAVTTYFSHCCNAPSVVTVFDTTNTSKTGQFFAGNGAFDAAFTPNGLYVYVSNNTSQTVSVVETSTWSIVATVSVGYAVQWIAMSPDGTMLYVGSFDSAQSTHLVSISTSTNSVQKTLHLDGFQSNLSISPDGKRLYLNMGSSFLVVDTKSLTVAGQIPNLNGIGVALSPDGKLAYVPNPGQGHPPNFNVAVIDTAKLRVVKNIPLSSRTQPERAAISPDGSLVYVGEIPYLQGSSSSIAVIDTSTNTVVHTIALPSGADPGRIVFGPHGKHAYVADFNHSAVDVVNVETNEVVAIAPTYGTVSGLAMSGDGRTLLVPNDGDSQTAMVGASGAVEAQIPVGSMGDSSIPQYGAAAVSPDGSRAYVTNLVSNNVSVIDTASQAVIANVYTGSEPLGIVLSPDGSKAYVANSFDDSMTVIDTKTFALHTIVMPKFGYPTSIAITPDGRHVYMTVDNIVPDFGNNPGYVFVVDTATETVAHTVKAIYPMGVAISPDGQKAYVVSEYSGSTLYTLSTSTLKFTAQLALGGLGALSPVSAGIAVTPDGKHIFIDDSSDGVIWKIEAATNKLVKTIPAGTIPGQMAITPDGTQLYAADYANTAASVIDVASGTVVKTIPLGSPSYGVALTTKGPLNTN